MATPPDDRRCKATSRRSGERCRQWAVAGFRVCRMHGAGSPKRVAEGRRQDPREASFVHGLYARRTHPRIAEAIAAYAEAGEQLWNLDNLIAQPWASLEALNRLAGEAQDFLDRIADADEGAFAVEDVTQMMRDVVDITKAADGAVNRIQRLIETRAKLKAAEGAVTRVELVATLQLFATWVRELAADPRVERDDLADRLVERIGTYAAGRQMGEAARADAGAGE